MVTHVLVKSGCPFPFLQTEREVGRGLQRVGYWLVLEWVCLFDCLVTILGDLAIEVASIVAGEKPDAVVGIVPYLNNGSL